MLGEYVWLERPPAVARIAVSVASASEFVTSPFLSQTD